MAASSSGRDEPGELVVGVDIGNSTTEASVAVVGGAGGSSTEQPGTDQPRATHLSAALTPTTGVKGTVKNVDGVVTAVVTALRRAGTEPRSLARVFLNEATPVISGLAMETVTETVITESAMIGHDPRTPGGVGLGVGMTVPIDDLPGDDGPGDGEPVIVVASGAHDFEVVAARINRALARGVPVVAAVLQNDDAVLVANRLDVAMPIVDEVSLIEKVPLGMRAAVEVAAPGYTIRTLSNAYGLATVFGLDADQTRAVSPVARAITGNRSAVVIRTPTGEIGDRVVPAGTLHLVGRDRSRSIDVNEGAAAIMDVVAKVAPLEDAAGESGTNVGGMLATVRQGMADLLGQPEDAVRIRDVLAVDTIVPREVRGGLAGEVALENAVALAAMVRTRQSGMLAVAEAVQVALRDEVGAADVQVQVGGVEAEMAVRGALTTPGTDRPLVVLDLGGGSTDAAVIDPDGTIRTTHVAGAGDLVTKLIASELGIDNLEICERVKKQPLARVESFFHARSEDGTVRFSQTPHPPSVFARVVTIDGELLQPVPTRHGVDHVRRIRRTAKERVFVVNALRALTQVAPRGNLRQIGFVVLLGGSALDFEIPLLIADALAPYGIVCGTGNVRGTEGPRNAVASGLVMAHVERLAALVEAHA